MGDAYRGWRRIFRGIGRSWAIFCGVALGSLAAAASAQEAMPSPAANLDIQPLPPPSPPVFQPAAAPRQAPSSTPRTGGTPARNASLQAAGPASGLETRLRELEQQFDEQRFQVESLRQQLDAERQAKQAQAAAAEKAAADEKAAGYRVGSKLEMRAGWANGIELYTPNRDFWFHVGGRTQVDGVWMQAPGNSLNGAGGVGAQDSVNIRRGRLRAEGTMYELIDWCAEYNFVGATYLNPGTPQPSNPATLVGQIAAVPSFTDLWWNFRRVPILGNFTIGNIKEPFGLERLESSRYLDFMERSFNQDAFLAPSNNGFAPGILVWNYAENRRMTYAAGLFKNVQYTPFAFGVGDGDYAADGRFTFLPYYDAASNGRYLVHLGLGGSYRGNDFRSVRYRARGSLRNGPDALNSVWADTGTIASKDEGILAPELMIIWGSLFIQAEYAATYSTQAVNSAGRQIGTAFFDGYYVQATYFLTGEHRLYDYQKGLVGRVVPYENAAFVRGASGRPIFLRGAWQVAARYNELNLNNKGINGGQLRDITLGLNWFLNPNMKLQWNVTLTHRDGQKNTADGNIYGAGMRVAQDF
ncbi:MAG TPA: porin [Pirellulales bacterium]|nr:porin [Pirellulales bacterium]